MLGMKSEKDLAFMGFMREYSKIHFSFVLG